MADLDPLIRFRKHGIDEKRRVLAELYRQTEQLQQQKKVIEEQMAHEKSLAEEMATLEASAYLGRYLEGARRKIRAIELSIKKMETRIAVAQEDVRNAFAEMKKVEITQRNRKSREKAERERKDSKELDEIAIEIFRRKQDED